MTTTRVCIVVATDATVRAFLLDQLRALARRYQVSVVANTSNPTALRAMGVPLDLTRVRIERSISIARDAAALVTLWRFFRRIRPTVVHSVTPKAGLLAMLAARAAAVPVRVHTFTGQVWATRSGAIRWMLRRADTLTARSATLVLADSRSQRDYLVAEGVAPAGKISVLGDGSISGVDLQRFRPDEAVRARVRSDLEIPDGATVFLYLGRLNRDKGVADLASAFTRLAPRQPGAYLVIAGPDEGRLTPSLVSELQPVWPRVRLLGFTDSPERLMAAADVFCLPSHREGFGTSVIEAAASGVPAIASRIYGLTDAVEHGATGLLHGAGDVAGIAALMEELSMDAGRRREMGGRAQRRAARLFSMERLTQEVLRLYDDLVAGRPR